MNGPVMAKTRTRGSIELPKALAAADLQDIAIKFDPKGENESARIAIVSGVPWSVEVGTGNGLYLEAIAAEHPERRYLGIERSGEFFVKTAKRAARAGRGNVRCIHGDAREVFESLLPPESVQEVIVNFSDPWPKRRHRLRRLFRAEFVSSIEKVLRPGGEVRFKTDVGWYFNQAIGELRRRVGWAIRESGPIDDVAPSTSDIARSPRVVTNFERKGRESGREVWGFVARWTPRGTSKA